MFFIADVNNMSRRFMREIHRYNHFNQSFSRLSHQLSLTDFRNSSQLKIKVGLESLGTARICLAIAYLEQGIGKIVAHRG